MNDSRPKIAVFLSGRGSGFRNLCLATRDGRLEAEISLLVSSKRKAGGLDYAREFGIESVVFRTKDFDSPEEAAASLLDTLTSRQIKYIALAGYLKLLPLEVVRAFPKRIVNIHPALLPRHGGKGMYGHYVHEAVIADGDKESGATVHLVDEIYDHGSILEQAKVPVEPDDTPDSLAARVLKVEHDLYPRVLQKLINGEYETTNE